MATLSEVNKGLVNAINGALLVAGVTGVEVGSEWPAKDALQNAASENGTPIVAVIHRMSNYQRKNMPFEHSETANPVGIKSALSDFFIGAGQSVTLTVALADGSTRVEPGDLISLFAQNGDFNDGAQYTAKIGDTINEVAAGLSLAINTLFTDLTASASGAVVTITCSGAGYKLTSNVGNKTVIEQTVNWACRSMQINIWSGSLARKFQIQPVVENLLATIDDQNGFFLDSGEFVQFKLGSAKPDDAETDKDVYCDMYLFAIENMVDIEIDKWAVVATSSETGSVSTFQ